MIHLDRSTVSAPRTLSGPLAARALEKARAFFRTSLASRRQQRFLFPNIYVHAEVQNTLSELFHGKCAYCESVIVDSPVGVDHFRPKMGAVGLRREYSPDHYWWLAYEWTNLYPACKACDNLKGAKFPVEGKRSPLEADQATLSKEKRLLLDPCVDEPSDHLAFDPSGSVRPQTRMGAITIDVIGLNRSSLIEARHNEALKLNEVLEVINQRVSQKLVASLNIRLEQGLFSVMHNLVSGAFTGKHTGQGKTVLFLLEKRLSPESAYLGMTRQILLSWLARKKGRLRPSPEKPRDNRRDELEILPSKPTVKKSPPDKPAEIATVRIEGVTIRNFRAIAYLELNYPTTGIDGAPWLMLLGENASGKSSVLQAVALVLAGKERRNELNVDASKCVRHGAEIGYIEVRLSGHVEPLRVEFGKQSRFFQGGASEVNVPVLGYGATRLLPIRRRAALGSSDLVRINNLFDPFIPLIDVGKWLGNLGAAAFDYTARAIKDVLAHDLRSREAARIVPSKDRKEGFRVRMFGEDISLDALSDGYQSVVGLSVDLISGLRVQQKGGLETAEGIVLLDEMGAHLHPRWRMHIVTSLRKAFPCVQFLASTHDPLCLRGLTDSEVVVLRRSPQGRVFGICDLPPVQGLRVDQLLTSEYFGLSSTRDPKIESQFHEYYSLLVLRHPTIEQRKRMKELGAILAEIDLPGTTRRERMLLQVIDSYLAHSEGQPSLGVREAIRKSAEGRLARHLNI